MYSISFSEFKRYTADKLMQLTRIVHEIKHVFYDLDPSC